MAIRAPTLCCLALCLLPGPAASRLDTAALCDAAARDAARASETPLVVLLAITRVETGRGTGEAIEPWPWTINQAGQGQWFDTAAEAAEAAETALADGTGNLDIGCFQLNHRWHGPRFSSLDQMFDPQANARYAAGFLSDLHRETGSWPLAISAYHSRNAGPAAAYLARFETVLAGLQRVPDIDNAKPPSPRRNAYPLLHAGSPGTGGSLVPRVAGNTPFIGAAP